MHRAAGRRAGLGISKRTCIETTRTYVVELLHDELFVATVLVQIGLERRAIGLIVAVRAPDANVRSTRNRPLRQGTVDDGAIGRQEGRKVLHMSA